MTSYIQKYLEEFVESADQEMSRKNFQMGTKTATRESPDKVDPIAGTQTKMRESPDQATLPIKSHYNGQCEFKMKTITERRRESPDLVDPLLGTQTRTKESPDR